LELFKVLSHLFNPTRWIVPILATTKLERLEQIGERRTKIEFITEEMLKIIPVRRPNNARPFVLLVDENPFGQLMKPK
jgi:hypothetical protein